MEENKLKLFYDNFSLITVSENKVPNFSWKQSQAKKMPWDKFSEQYNYQGGKTWVDKDGVTHEILKTNNFGIVTGFEYLECIDVDLKVFSTAKEQKEFWDEYSGYLRDNILDFDEKFVVYKTKNAGYHILYKTKRVEGNLKLARLKGHKEAVIETRGIGGYIFTYPDNKVSKKSYHQIEFISDEDRFILMSFSKMYNFVEELPEAPKKEKKEYAEGEITPWDDYNQKHTVFDIINDEFTIVGNLSKKYVIKRHGGTSPHSGYVFKDTGFLYLFSTACDPYPHEKLITPFYAYTLRYHNGDFSEATKAIYEKGYGSRRKQVIKELKKTVDLKINESEPVEINKSDLVFPIEIFPKDIQTYLIECNTKLDSSIEYMGCSLLWLISVCIGNSIEVEVKKGWTENLSVWISIVGKAGLGKTPSISNIIFPLIKINAKEIKTYIKESEKYEYYNSLSKKEKEEHSEVPKPTKTQFIANDITLEALVDLHQESDNAVGVFKDELAGWLKDMNKYREGSDLEFWLSTWSGKSVNLNRLTRKGSFVEKPFIPVLGGIQPSIFNTFYTDENKDNGFMDRMLLCYPDLKVDYYNENEISEEILKWYKEIVISFYDILKGTIKRNEDGDIVSNTAVFSEEARTEWKRIFNEMTDVQNNEEENEYLKSMFPKQKSYIPRFSALIHVFDEFFGEGGNTLLISKESVLKAEKLSKYFVATAKKIKINSVEVSKLKSTLTANKGKNEKEKLLEIWKINKSFNRSETAELLGISRRSVQNWCKEFENAHLDAQQIAHFDPRAGLG